MCSSDLERSATLVLARATEAQAGTYACVVSNANGSVTSDASTLSFIAATAAETGRLINLSILSVLEPGERMTMGTVLGGPGTSGTKALLARAAGPALAQLGVPNFLPDPQMTLARPGGVAVATNDNWGGSATLATAFAQVGAFAYAASDSKDAAILQPALATGDYTIEVGDRAGSPGFMKIGRAHV